MIIGGKTLVSVNFPENQYVRTAQIKKQICLHHTVSPVGVEGDLAWWLQTTERIATAIIVHHDGTPYQCFGSQYWASHLGANNSKLDRESIGIELDSMGPLLEYNGKWYMIAVKDGKRIPNMRREVKPCDVQFYPNGYRGYEAFERYTDNQIFTSKELIKLWGQKYGISLRYNEDMWDVSPRALAGASGVWSHTSYRKDKSDVHPQPELICMLQSLSR